LSLALYESLCSLSGTGDLAKFKKLANDQAACSMTIEEANNALISVPELRDEISSILMEMDKCACTRNDAVHLAFVVDGYGAGAFSPHEPERRKRMEGNNAKALAEACEKAIFLSDRLIETYNKLHQHFCWSTPFPN
jgi:hypothetical protein